jgi:hypothetical protein
MDCCRQHFRMDMRHGYMGLRLDVMVVMLGRSMQACAEARCGFSGHTA